MRLARRLCGMPCCAGVTARTPAGRARPAPPPGLSPFYPSISVLRPTASFTPALDFARCPFSQAGKVYSSLTLHGFRLCSGSQSITQLRSLPACLPQSLPAVMASAACYRQRRWRCYGVLGGAAWGSP